MLLSNVAYVSGSRFSKFSSDKSKPASSSKFSRIFLSTILELSVHVIVRCFGTFFDEFALATRVIVAVSGNMFALHKRLCTFECELRQHVNMAVVQAGMSNVQVSLLSAVAKIVETETTTCFDFCSVLLFKQAMTLSKSIVENPIAFL